MVKMASSKAQGERAPEACLWRELKADIILANTDRASTLVMSLRMVKLVLQLGRRREQTGGVPSGVR